MRILAHVQIKFESLLIQYLDCRVERNVAFVTDDRDGCRRQPLVEYSLSPLTEVADRDLENTVSKSHRV